MHRNTPDAAPDPAASEQRRLPRKNVLLTGVIADLESEQSWECTIHDINARGAAISVGGRMPAGAQLYLLDTESRAAHVARVMWSNYERSGVLFDRSYAMGLGLPSKMQFLWRLLLEAKLRQADRAVAKGISPDLALGSVGLTREQVHQMARYASTDVKFQQLLRRAKHLFHDEDE